MDKFDRCFGINYRSEDIIKILNINVKYCTILKEFEI